MADSLENQLSSPDEAPPRFAAAAQEKVTYLVLVVTFLLIFIMAARTPLDTDLWWHLRSGEETLRSGRPLLSDLFSFTRYGAPWVNHSWLSQVGMALLFRWGGYFALGLAMALMATLSMGLALAQCQGPVFLKSGALLLGSVVASVVWVPRPQIISLALLALVGYLMYLYKWRGRDVLWALPLIFILWSNLHGGYALGFLLAAAALAGEVLNHLIGLKGAPVLSWKRILRLGGWVAICCLAVLINPNGLDTWRIPFQTIHVEALQQFIPEWASPDFHSPLEFTLLLLLLATFAAAALSGRVMDGVDLLTLCGFAILALVAKRNFGPFALAAVPILTRYAASGLEAWRERSPWLARFSRSGAAAQKESGAARGLKKAINLGLAALLALVAFGKLYVVTQPALVSHYLEASYPMQAVAWLANNRPAGERVLNEYAWGGYLQWALPDARVFVDGRTDLFGDEVIGAWIKAVQAQAGWQAILDRYGVDLVMLSPDRPLLKALPAAGWQVVYHDSQVVIYERGK